MNSNKKISRLGFIKLIAKIGAFVFSIPASAEQKNITYLKNAALDTILPGYKGNLVYDGRFSNEIKMPKISFGTILKWRFSFNPQKDEKNKDPFRLNVIKNRSFCSAGRDMIVWLGHSSFFIRLDQKNFLLDPVFFKPPVVSRLASSPCSVNDIKNIDYLLVSHAHLDHLDSRTIKRVALSDAAALVPLGMGELITSWNKNIKIQEGGWYQRFDTPVGTPEVFMLPAQHWSRRGAGDTNEVLWGSYMIRGKNKSVYFAGDTAYSPHFKMISSLFGPTDYCILPIAAYKPPYIMKGSHISPWEAVDSFHDLKGKTFIPMHYATFDLADEPRGEPVRAVKRLEADNKINGRVEFLDPGHEYVI